MPKVKSRHLVLEILFALALFALLVAILVTELSRTKDAYFYERVDLVSYTQTDTLYGYVFRNEIAPNTLNNGPIDYRVKDGTTVTDGTVLAHVYRDDSGADKRERAAMLYAQIAELETALNVSQTNWTSAYLSDYAALMRELSASNTTTALTPAHNTATAICARDAQAERQVLLTEIATLQEQINALTAHANDYLPAKATDTGVFYHTADGYEALFGISQIDHLTPQALSELLSASPKLDTVIGKLVCVGPWYFAVPLCRTLAQTYTADTAYLIHFREGSITMHLDRIYTDDTEDALLIFSAQESPAWLSCDRRQEITVEKGITSALSVPTDALSADHTLFVLCDGVAQLRHVTPVLQEQGVTLVLPSQENTLNEGDRVIVSTKQLFDGKVLQ